MKRVLALALATLYAIVLMCFAAPLTQAANQHNISLTVTVDPDAELDEGGPLSWLRFDITNGGASDYTLHYAAITCHQIGLNENLSDQLTISGGAAREFHLYDVNIPDSSLGKELTFTLTWTDISYSASDPQHNAPINTEQSADAKATIDRFIQPVIQISSSCDVEMAKPQDKVEIVYTLENNTKFDMFNLVVYDSKVVKAPLVLQDTTLLSGMRMTVKYEAVMEQTDLVSQPIVTYTVKNKPVETQASSIVTISCAIVQLEMSVQQLPATTEGVEFSITVTNSGTHEIKDIQIFDEINTKVDEPFNLEASQSKSITYTVRAATSASQTRFVSFHMTGTDCFGEEYLYSGTTSYELIPYVDASNISIHLEAVLANSSFDEGGNLNATIYFTIRNDSIVPVFNASLVEQGGNSEQPIKSFVELNTGTTAFSSDFFIVKDTASLSFVLKASDSAGNACSSEIVTIDLSGAFKNSSSLTTLQNPGNVIGGQLDTSKITDVVWTILIVVMIIVALGTIVIVTLYFMEIKQRPNIITADTHFTTSRIVLDENEVVTFDTKSPVVQTDKEDVLPFEGMGYVAPARLRYYVNEDTASKQQPKARPVAAKEIEPSSKSTVKVDSTRPVSKVRYPVRTMELKKSPKQLPLIWNEKIRVGIR